MAKKNPDMAPLLEPYLSEGLMEETKKEQETVKVQGLALTKFMPGLSSSVQIGKVKGFKSRCQPL